MSTSLLQPERQQASISPSPPAKRLRRDFIVIAHDLLAIWDALTVLVAAYLCAVLYSAALPESDMMPAFFGTGAPLALVGALLAPFVLRERWDAWTVRATSAVGVVRRVMPRVLMLLAALLATSFLTKTTAHLPRIWACSWSLAIGVLAVSGRLFLARYIHELDRAGVLRERVAIVGSPPAADALRRMLSRLHGVTTEIVGVFDDMPADAAEGTREALQALVEIGKRQALDRVLVAPQRPASPGQALDDGRLARITRELKALDVQVAFCPDTTEIDVHGRRLERLGELPLFVLASRAIGCWGLVQKEIEDKVVGLLLLLASLPLMGLIALAIRLDSPGPVIFVQRRHGWNNREFEIFKFRTMRAEPHRPADRVQQTERNDRRVTRVGAALRRMSLDELPQLLNVLRGDMSLVGPRPHPVVMRTESRLCNEIVAEYAHRHRVKPGITGWAQIHGCRGATQTAAQVRRRVELDIEYIENWSVLLDLKILLLTPVKLVFDRGNAF
jgi:Undecaprenyl-phosphate glucose phosphotransferase